MFHIVPIEGDFYPLESFCTLQSAVDAFKKMVSIIANEAPWQNEKFCVTDDWGKVVYK